MQPLRILIVDDHLLMRDGLRALLSAEADLHVVGEARDSREAAALARSLQPDVVLMDIRLPDVDGIEATRQVRNVAPNAAVVILTMYDRDEYLFSALKAGAVGYILKDSPSHEVVSAVRSAARGQSWLHPAMARKLVESVSLDRSAPGASKAPGTQLTERELQVLSLMAKGRTNAEIGETLFLSEQTIKQHVSKIFRKVGVRSRSQAVIYAVQHGLAE